MCITIAMRTMHCHIWYSQSQAAHLYAETPCNFCNPGSAIYSSHFPNHVLVYSSDGFGAETGRFDLHRKRCLILLLCIVVFSWERLQLCLITVPTEAAIWTIIFRFFVCTRSKMLYQSLYQQHHLHHMLRLHPTFNLQYLHQGTRVFVCLFGAIVNNER